MRFKIIQVNRLAVGVGSADAVPSAVKERLAVAPLGNKLTGSAVDFEALGDALFSVSLADGGDGGVSSVPHHLEDFLQFLRGLAVTAHPGDVGVRGIFSRQLAPQVNQDGVPLLQRRVRAGARRVVRVARVSAEADDRRVVVLESVTVKVVRNDLLHVRLAHLVAHLRLQGEKFKGDVFCLHYVFGGLKMRV